MVSLFVRLGTKFKCIFDILLLDVLRFVDKNNFEGENRKKILIVRLDHKLGDMSIFIEFLLELSKAYVPDEIDLVIHDSQKKLFDNCHIVSNIYTYSWGSSLKRSFFLRVFSAYKFYKSKLKGSSYSLVLIPRVDYDLHAALIGFFAKDQEMIGWTEHASEYKSLVNFRFDTLYSDVLSAEKNDHELKNSQILLRSIVKFAVGNKVYSYWWQPQDMKAVNDFLDLNIKTNGFVCIAPGAFDMKRQWPIEKFQLVSDAIYKEYGYVSLYLGSSNEFQLCEAAVSNLKGNAHNLAGSANFGFIYCLLSKSSLFLGNDSGLMHFASLANTKVVEVSCHPVSGSCAHQNSPVRFGPWSEVYAVVQPLVPLEPCSDCCSSEIAHCISTICVTQVLDAARKLLN